MFCLFIHALIGTVKVELDSSGKDLVVTPRNSPRRSPRRLVDAATSPRANGDVQPVSTTNNSNMPHEDSEPPVPDIPTLKLNKRQLELYKGTWIRIFRMITRKQIQARFNYWKKIASIMTKRLKAYVLYD